MAFDAICNDDNCGSKQYVSDHHEAVAVKQLDSPLDVLRIHELEVGDADVLAKFLAQCHDARVIGPSSHVAHAGSPATRFRCSGEVSISMSDSGVSSPSSLLFDSIQVGRF